MTDRTSDRTTHPLPRRAPPLGLALVALTAVAAGALVATSRVSAEALPSDATFVRRAADVPAYPIAGGKGTAAIFYDAARGSPDAALSVLELRAGAAVPPHVHDESTEMLYVIAGEAEMTIAGQTLRLGPGDAARIPRGIEHAARVVGDATLRAVQLYLPPGPEQRFIPKP